MTTKDGSVFRFSGISDGFTKALFSSTLEAIADRFGNTITVAPGGNSFTDTTGRSISLTPHGTL